MRSIRFFYFFVCIFSAFFVGSLSAGSALSEVGQQATLDVSSRIVNGELSDIGSFPFTTALRTRRHVSLTVAGSRTNSMIFEHSTPSSMSAELALCKYYADDSCAVRDKVCVLYLHYEVAGFVPETPGQQLDRCAAVGGVGAVFLTTQYGDLGIRHVRDAISSIPAVYGGDGSKTWVHTLLANIGSTLRIAELIDNKVNCGGSYLGNRWVLTAAHCVVSFTDDGKKVVNRPESLTATVGINDLNLSDAYSEVLLIEEIHASPDFQADETGLHSDWAVLRLSAEPKSGFAIKVARQDAVEAAKRSAGDVTLIGWGAQDAYFPGNRPDSMPSPSELYHAVVSLTDTQTCNQGFVDFYNAYFGVPSPKTILDSEVCHGKSPSFDVNVCHGDSGGPIVLNIDGEYQLAGITSWGLGCAPGVPNLYSVSTSPSYHIDKLSNIVGFNVEASDSAPTVTTAGISDKSGGGGSFSAPMGAVLGLFLLLGFGRRTREGSL